MNTLKKNANGYNYQYTDLAEIHKYLEENGLNYYQFIKINEQGVEQVFTKRSDIDEPIPGCKVPQATLQGKSNPAQEYGSALTYARRYSLLMAYGLATTDDDAESLTVSGESMKSKSRSTSNSKASTVSNRNEQTDKLTAEIKKYADEHGMTMREIAKDYGLNNATATEAKLKEVLADLKSEQQTSMADDFDAINEALPF